MKNPFWNTISLFFLFAVFLGPINSSGWKVADEEPTEDAKAEQQLRERCERSRLRIALKLQLLRQLVDGRCTLSEASSQLSKFVEPELQPQIRRFFPAETLEQSVAMQLIQCVPRLRLEPKKTEELVERLNKELEQMKASSVS